MRAAARMHLPQRFVHHPQPIDFLTLCDGLISPNTRYLVLDVDRTIHRNRNLGELLGWELSCYQGYGDRYLSKAFVRTQARRFYFDTADLAALLRYLWKGSMRWAWPGLCYALCIKFAASFGWGRRWLYRTFGPDPIDAVQSLPREVLLKQMAEVPGDVCRQLMRALWQRLEPDQVILREDIQTLRKRYPQLRIVLCSASPQPVLEVAQEALGADDILYTEIECHSGNFCAPSEARFAWKNLPPRLSPPSRTRHNSSIRKIEALLARYPDFLTVETVGISDTSHGEDHRWADFFTKVADVNSPDPYPLFAAPDSPLREVHSARLRTRRERATPVQGTPVLLDAEQLGPLLARWGQRVATLRERYERECAQVRRARDAVAAEVSRWREQIEQAVHEYNAATATARKKASRRLRSLQAYHRRAMRRMRRLDRRAALVLCQLSLVLEHSRSELTAKIAA